MSAYQNFLDFFSMHNKERLDGLSEAYFTPMTDEERSKAFDFLLAKLDGGGTEEVIHGLFRANPTRAAPLIKVALEHGVLSDEAQIAAAWNINRLQTDHSLQSIFIRHFSNENAELRGKAAYYVPSDPLTDELKAGLHGMVRTETDTLALIHATNKLLECYGITRNTVDKQEFSRFYRGLRSDDMRTKEATFRLLDDLLS